LRGTERDAQMQGASGDERQRHSSVGVRMTAFPSIRRVLQGRAKPGKVSPLAMKKAMPFR
jgi:hypothetical protein